jgi:hypothetical protein
MLTYKKEFRTQFVDTVIISLNSKFHKPGSINSLLIVIKATAKRIFFSDAMLLVYIVLKELPKQKLNILRGTVPA